ncbi:hypothetical protein P9D34_01225 [Bacillus swezeyi]|uniref:Uncharacterized protein n=1 Tax=Bacillus swezeyi TaxID=1925020 RepID=A0A1R1S1S1_9BACI|nr:hypothetical protein [Bacillus swezeyi]MEC1259081.1 hypothetical protein [Bacillus swezeyi]MED1737941.1 hypothetical protein [Bacillus swezeyi]MED2927958.1 hypothetical protein [Bacillus swezeyi]MED2942218.1 hypothetical protein [Bacillus swezeyi]MED2965130.1 hypothetical protein [Bacillus swezeyi]
MIILLVLFALLILYSFFFDKRNNRSYQKPAKSKTSVRQASSPPVFLKVIESAPGQEGRRQPSEGMRPNLRLVMDATKQHPEK